MPFQARRRICANAIQKRARDSMVRLCLLCVTGWLAAALPALADSRYAQYYPPRGYAPPPPGYGAALPCRDAGTTFRSGPRRCRRRADRRPLGQCRPRRWHRRGNSTRYGAQRRGLRLMAVRIGWRRNLNTNEVGLEERRDMKTRFVPALLAFAASACAGQPQPPQPAPTTISAEAHTSSIFVKSVPEVFRLALRSRSSSPH